MPTTLHEFESVWPRIVADLQDHAKGYKLPQQSLDWFTKVLLWTMLPNSHMLTVFTSLSTTTQSVENAIGAYQSSTPSLF